MKVDIVAPSAGEWHSQKGFSGICHAVKNFKRSVVDLN